MIFEKLAASFVNIKKMRIGINPQKESKILKIDTYHRIVVVVYIPNEEGFYKNSLNVFKLCIDSIIATSNSSSAITVVNNGSYNKVSDLLALYSREKKIDTLISHNSNIGKIDAQIGAARGSREKYITLTDADILFVKGWQEKVLEIFTVFPNVGSVSPIPVRTGLLAGTSSVLKQIIFRNINFKFIAIPENLGDYNKFLVSINWDVEVDENKKWPVIWCNSVKAIVGSAHQVLTVDRDVFFTTSPSNPSYTLVGGNSESDYVDVPIDKSGKLRLATYNNYAFHMGNDVEEWMVNVNENIVKSSTLETILPSRYTHSDLFNNKVNNKFYHLKKMVIKKLFTTLFKIE